MTQLTTDAAIQRFGENEERVDKFVNEYGSYNTTGGQSVETLPSFILRKDEEIDNRYPDGYVNRGAFAASTNYAINDIVTYGGLAYLCLEAYTSSATTPDNDRAHWVVYQGLMFKRSTNAITRPQEEFTKERISIRMYGGEDDWNGSTGTDTAAAMAKLATDFPNGCIIHFPKTNTGVYNWLSLGAGDFNKFVWDIDPGVTFRFPWNYFQGIPDAKFVRDMTAYFADMNGYYTLKASYPGRSDFHKNKSAFFGQGDRDTTLISPVDLSSSFVEKIGLNPWPDGPFAASTQISANARKADISLAGGNNGFHAVEIPIEPGCEYSCWFDTPLNWDGMLFFGVTTQNGYDCYYEGAGTPYGGGSHMIKEFGSPYQNGSTPVLNANDHSSVWAKNGICTVRCISYNNYVILVNGVERYWMRATASAIKGVFFGAGFGTSNAIVAVRDVVKLKFKDTRGQKPMRILTIGDSITDQVVHGSWPTYMCEALEGFMGIRVRELRNIAVSGYRSGDMWTVLQSTTITDIDVAVILIGVNDIQGLTDPDAYFAHYVGLMLDQLNALDIPCIVGVPTMFYTRAQGFAYTGFANQGQNSQNYDKGAPYRGRLLYEVASRNQLLNRICFGTLEELGPVVATWLQSNETVDEIMTDNIHPTAHARRLMGYLFARTVAGALAPAIKKSYPSTRFQSSWFANSWNDTRDTAGYEIDDAGHVKMWGLCDKNAGVLTNDTVVLKLPAFLRPSKTCRFSVAAETSNGAFNGSMMILIESNTGNVKIYGAPVNTTGFYFDNIQYKLNWN